MTSRFGYWLSKTATALLLLAFAAASFAQTFWIEDFGLLVIGAEAWPRILAGLLFVLSLAYLVTSAKAPDEERQDAGGGVLRMLSRHANPIGVFVLFFLFLVTLPVLGMLVGLLLFCFLILVLMGERSWRAVAGHAALAVLIVGACWSIFTYGLRVFLPSSPLFGL